MIAFLLVLNLWIYQVGIEWILVTTYLGTYTAAAYNQAVQPSTFDNASDYAITSKVVTSIRPSATRLMHKRKFFHT